MKGLFCGWISIVQHTYLAAISKVSTHKTASFLCIHEDKICCKVMMLKKCIKIQILHFFHFVHFVLKDFCHSAGTQFTEAKCLLSHYAIYYFNMIPLFLELGTQTRADQLLCIFSSFSLLFKGTLSLHFCCCLQSLFTGFSGSIGTCRFLYINGCSSLWFFP